MPAPRLRPTLVLRNAAVATCDAGPSDAGLLPGAAVAGDDRLVGWIGVAVNSGLLDGLPTAQAKERITAWLAEQGLGARSVAYKLRDWLFSRQRYWGEPFPVIHLEDGTTKLVPESDLPVMLPNLDDFRRTGEFETPLSRARAWIETTDPATGKRARRDSNTMPQWAGSCWYYLRFADPHNDREAWSQEAERYWLPVDLYVGGAEHTVLHLLYSRFWHKVLYALRARSHQGAVREAAQPRNDPRVQLPILRRQPERRPRRQAARVRRLGGARRR